MLTHITLYYPTTLVSGVVGHRNGRAALKKKFKALTAALDTVYCHGGPYAYINMGFLLFAVPEVLFSQDYSEHHFIQQ